MVVMRVAGREWPLKFTLNAMDTIEERTGRTVDELNISVKTRALRRGAARRHVPRRAAGGAAPRV